MAQVDWSARSASDLRAIYELIRRDSPDSALILVSRLVHSVRQLQEFPQSGRIVSEFGRGEIREVGLGAYRIVYRIEGAKISIVTIRYDIQSTDRE